MLWCFFSDIPYITCTYIIFLLLNCLYAFYYSFIPFYNAPLKKRPPNYRSRFSPLRCRRYYCSVHADTENSTLTYTNVPTIYFYDNVFIVQPCYYFSQSFISLAWLDAIKALILVQSVFVYVHACTKDTNSCIPNKFYLLYSFSVKINLERKLNHPLDILTIFFNYLF